MSLAGSYFLVPLSVSGAVTAGAQPGAVLPFAARLVSVTANVGTAPTGAALEVNVTRNATAVTGTSDSTGGPVTIAAGTTASPIVTAAVSVSPGQNVYAPTVKDNSDIADFAAGDVVALNVAQVGSTVAGSNLVVMLAFQKL